LLPAGLFVRDPGALYLDVKLSVTAKYL